MAGVKVVKVPVTDGGDGMLEVFLQLFDCKEILLIATMRSCVPFKQPMPYVQIYGRHRDCFVVWYKSS